MLADHIRNPMTRPRQVAMLRRNFQTDIQIVDLLWINPAALGLAAGAEANIKNLLADSGTNVVLIRAESNFATTLADQDPDRVRVIAIGEPGRRIKREAWVLWLTLRAKLQRRHIFYTSWVPRLCASVLVLPVKCRVFVHDLNIWRARIYDARFRQPSFPSRLHQYLSIKRANVVQCFARSVGRQLGLLRREPIPVGGQTVRILQPAPARRPGHGAVIFLDDRSYKGTWLLGRLYSSTAGFQLTVIGKIDPANEALLKSRGVAVRALRPSNKDKFNLLNEADYVIFASKYEGFGLPPREAAAVGTPSLIARRAALLDIPASLSLSVGRFGDRIDLTEVSTLAAQIDGGALKQWAAEYLGPVSTCWTRTAPLQ
jgi:glycosyltransferase involved in cell wall biosynthesis